MERDVRAKRGQSILCWDFPIERDQRPKGANHFMYLYFMKPHYKLLLSYLIALSITIVLAFIDSDPTTNYYSFARDIFFMSILIWGLGLLMYGVKLMAQKKNH